ncbi:hypothetical protein QAD02_009367 [Eretmocerus hayati]|uniref:Uncharacterized protein n=1 Tax=Eretmocerus hayati TaxID=131215 RepID=A0ACC2N917_9HYME|nr:hypothetical protein QAD02_009367 [Eretmocerus hayati]
MQSSVAKISHTQHRLSPQIALFFATLLAVSLAAPQGSYYSTPIPIVRSVGGGPNSDGSYAWEYETGNGIRAEEQGQFQPGQIEEQGTASVRGSYSYTAPDGTPISLNYVADENGFQPQGAHLPKVPAIPEGIARGLEWIANHPEQDNL